MHKRRVILKNMNTSRLCIERNDLNYGGQQFYRDDSPYLISHQYPSNSIHLSNDHRSYASKPISSCSYEYPSESSEEVSSSILSYNDLSSNCSMESLTDDGFQSCSTSISNFKQSYNQSQNGSIASYCSSLQSNSVRSVSDQVKPFLSGILKRTENNFEDAEILASKNTRITLEIQNKIQENELEDILQYADDIISPDPSTLRTCSSQPVKVVEGSFRHVLSVKDTKSKSTAFKYRTIEICKNDMPDLGFSVRKGDGWENMNGIYISRVYLGSVFDKYELLTVGDEIIQINKVAVNDMSIDDVIKIMQIPKRLCLTVKILTPFSCKKAEKSNDDRKKIISRSINYDKYKVAQLKIDTKTNNITNKAANTSKRTSNKTSNLKTERRSVKLSPYRTMEGGAVVQSNKVSLSPIPENNSQQYYRKTSFVTWSDLIYNDD